MSLNKNKIIKIYLLFSLIFFYSLCLQAQKSEDNFAKMEEKIRQENSWKPVDLPDSLSGSFFLEGSPQDPNNFQNYHIKKAFYWKILTLSDSLLFQISIYLLPSQRNSFAFYSSEKTPSSKFFNIGFESFLSGQKLTTWYGEYVLKITYMDSTYIMEKPITEFTEKIVNIIPKQKREIPILDSLPEKNRVKNSEKFYFQKWLGQNYFQNIYYADYFTPEGYSRIFIINNKTTASADSNFWQYYSFMKNNAEVSYEELKVDTDYYIVVDPIWGKTILAKKNQIIYGILDFRNSSWSIDRLKDILNELKKRKIVKSG